MQSQQVDDPNDYNQIQRLKRLHQVRREVGNIRRKMADATITGAATKQQRDAVYFETVTGYVQEIEPMLVDNDLTAAKNYWEGVELGEIVFEPPEEAVKKFQEVVRQMPNNATPPAAKTVQVTGLGEFLSLTPPFTQEWSIAYRYGNEVKHDTFSQRCGVSREISDNAYRACNRFLRDVGVDAKLEEVREVKDIEWGSTTE